MALYGIVLLLATVAVFHPGARFDCSPREGIRRYALGRDFKGKVSVVIYVLAVPLAFVNSWLACGLYVLVAVMWLIPDRRIERH